MVFPGTLDHSAPRGRFHSGAGGPPCKRERVARAVHFSARAALGWLYLPEAPGQMAYSSGRAAGTIGSIPLNRCSP